MMESYIDRLENLYTLAAFRAAREETPNPFQTRLAIEIGGLLGLTPSEVRDRIRDERRLADYRKKLEG